MMTLHNAFAESQPNARPRVLLPGVQALEDDKDALKKLGSMPMPLSRMEMTHSPDRAGH